MVAHYGDLGVVEKRPGVADDRHFPPEMFVESEPYAPGAAAPTATLGVENQQQIQERQAMVAAAEAIPYRRGLYVGHVGKAARRR